MRGPTLPAPMRASLCLLGRIEHVAEPDGDQVELTLDSRVLVLPAADDFCGFDFIVGGWLSCDREGGLLQIFHVDDDEG